MSTGFAFKQSLHLCNVSILRIFLVFQLRTFKVGFRARNISGAFEKRAPGVHAMLFTEQYFHVVQFVLWFELFSLF